MWQTSPPAFVAVGKRENWHNEKKALHPIPTSHSSIGSTSTYFQQYRGVLLKQTCHVAMCSERGSIPTSGQGRRDEETLQVPPCSSRYEMSASRGCLIVPENSFWTGTTGNTHRRRQRDTVGGFSTGNLGFPTQRPCCDCPLRFRVYQQRLPLSFCFGGLTRL